MDALLEKYQTQFKQQFPLMLCRHMSEDEICKVVQQCLDDNKPYEPDLDPDANY